MPAFGAPSSSGFGASSSAAFGEPWCLFPLSLNLSSPLVKLPTALHVYAAPLYFRVAIVNSNTPHMVTCVQEDLELQHPKVLPLVRQHLPRRLLERPQVAPALPLGGLQRHPLAVLVLVQPLPLVQAQHQPLALGLVQPQLQHLAQCQRLPLGQLPRHSEVDPPLHLAQLLGCQHLEHSQARHLAVRNLVFGVNAFCV